MIPFSEINLAEDLAARSFDGQNPSYFKEDRSPAL
jgi:hypothetical protein